MKSRFDEKAKDEGRFLWTYGEEVWGRCVEGGREEVEAFEEGLEAVLDLKLEGLRRLGFLGIGENILAPQVPQDVPFPFRPSFSLTTLIFVP